MEREICFMLPFGADYVIFWRKKWSFMLPFGADHVTFSIITSKRTTGTTNEKACFKNFLGKFLWLFPLIAAQ